MDYLYPRLEDEEFNLKLSQHKELRDHQYDGYITSVKDEAEALCNADFELATSEFCENFMSFNTPYNSLLLYHGLGSGKTCSAIGISEEMRKYMKQLVNVSRLLLWHLLMYRITSKVNYLILLN